MAHEPSSYDRVCTGKKSRALYVTLPRQVPVNDGGYLYPVDHIGTSPLDSDLSVDSAATFSKDGPGKLLLFAFKIKVSMFLQIT